MIAYFGHPKSGSTWLGGIMAGISRSMGMKYFYGQLSLPKVNPKKLISSGVECIISQNTTYDKVEQLDDFKAFHVIRDPRDMIISGYFSYLKTHPLDQEGYFKRIREKLQTLNKSDGILYIMEVEHVALTALKKWDYNDPRILELKFEDVKTDPFNEIKRAITHLGILGQPNDWYELINVYNRANFRIIGSNKLTFKQKSIPLNYLNSLIKSLSFENLSGNRKIGQENTNSHYRKGAKGDWKNHFNEKISAHFKNKFGDLLINLGYESNKDW